MADKKKKVIITKESIAPRKPVILKSDREVAKDPPKEKVEKEKPTIILKTREQSASKEERSQSPKPQSDGGPHPSKIAHNDHKEKKVTEKPSPPLKKFPEAMKLLNENLEFNSGPLQYLNDSNSNYLVVGIMGLQGVGKSLILNLIEQSKEIPDLCEKILNTHEIQSVFADVSTIEGQMENLDFSSSTEAKENNKGFVFKMQDMDHIERGVHCTKGIDMYVTNDRVILLDCQALWAPSLIEETNTNPITSRSANIVTVDCLQLASYLISICHVVIAVQDWFTDYNFIRYIQTAEMLKPTLTAAAIQNTSQESSDMPNKGPSSPHLLLLHNRCQLEDFTPEALETMQNLYRKAFKTSSLQLHSGMYMYSDTNKNGLNIDSMCKGYNFETCGPPINFFLLPEIYSDYDNHDIYRGHPPFEQLAKRLRWMVLGVNRHQITNIPDLSEKGWFQYCHKAWETIRKCTFFMEYERFLP